MRAVQMVVMVLALVLAAACGRAGQSFDAAIVGGDWPRVVAGSLPGEPGATRVLQAHAALALNRNNQAVCALAGASSDDLRAWDAWTRSFVGRHPTSAVAHYLRGDALARRSDWGGAAKELDVSLDLEPESVLALNARGIVRSFMKMPSAALMDFLRAGEIDPRFVDAMASRGSSLLQSRTAPEGALDAFTAALAASPDFALAAIGKAHAQLALSQWDAGNRALAVAAGRLPCAPHLVQDGIDRMVAWADAQFGTTAIAENLPPGTQLDRHLRNFVNGDVGALKPIARIVGSNPELVPKATATLQATRQQNPALYNEAIQRISSGREWTKPAGGAETLLSGLKDIRVGGGATVGKAPLTVNGNVSVGASGAVENQINKTRIDYQGWTRLERAVGAPSAAGGVTTSLASAYIDRGDWPFEPIYTLLYGEKAGVR